MFAVIFLIALAPIVAASVPPLHDYPFHLARADILARLPNAPFVSAHYTLNGFLIPNLGMDVVMLALTQFLPVEIAGRVFLALTLGIILSGVAALHHALHRRLSAWPLLACAFLYNWILLFGFLNYLLGVGLTFWAVAIWIHRQDAPPVSRISTATLSALVLALCHLESFGVYALMVAGIEIHAAACSWQRRRSETIRRLFVSALPFVAVLILFAVLSPTASEAQKAFDYNPWWGWKPLVAYRTLQTSIRWLDVTTMIALTGGVGISVLLGLRIAAPIRLGVVFLVAAFLLLPSGLFGALYADARMPVVIVFALIAATDLTWAGGGRRQCGLFLAVALPFAAHTAIVASDWVRSSQTIETIATAFNVLPEDSTLFAATAAPYPSLGYRTPAELDYWRPPLKHVVSLASLNRLVFVPATWANPRQQPIRVTPQFAAIKMLQGDNPFQIHTEAELVAIIAKIDFATGPASQDHRRNFLLLLYPDLMTGTIPPQLKIVVKGEYFVLLELTKRSVAAGEPR